jgi:hypothetical protein
VNQKQFDTALTDIADRSSDVRSLGNDLLEAWGFDLEKRSPGVAYVDSAGKQVTTLDMACLLTKLVEWGSTINVPAYKSVGAATRKEGQVVTSKENRHGKIVGIVSHKEVFNFNFRIHDANVMTSHGVGDWRNFQIFHAGTWHDGLRQLTFLPTEHEKELLAKIPSNGNTIVFKDFISPNRWPSFYGRHYLLAKALIPRLADQKKTLNKQISAIMKELKIEPEPWPKSEKIGETKPKEVWRFTAVVDGVAELKGDYATFPATKAGLEDAQNLKSRLNAIQERLSFQVRATEWAFFERVRKVIPDADIVKWVAGSIHDDKQPSRPSWVLANWESWRQSNRHKPWMEIEVHGLKLRFQAARKTIQVAA